MYNSAPYVRDSGGRLPGKTRVVSRNKDRLALSLALNLQTARGTMNATDHRSRRIRPIRTAPLQLFFLVSSVFFAAITPSPVQFFISGVILVLVGIAMTITTLRKEPAPPEVFLEEEHFEAGGTVRARNGNIRAGFSTHPMFRMLMLSPTPDVLTFSLAYGLGKFIGPWTLQKAEVARIERVRTWFTAHDAVRIVPVTGQPWYFLTHEPGTVLACLEELGYPVSGDLGRWP